MPGITVGCAGPRITPAVAGRRTSVTNEDMLVKVRHSKSCDHGVDMLNLELTAETPRQLRCYPS